MSLIFTEGKQLAASRDVKFIETSSGIQHNVDELLVGILKQVEVVQLIATTIFTYTNLLLFILHT